MTSSGRSTELFLETDRLLLRRFTESDADLLIYLDADPGVMRYLSGGRPTPREVIQNEILPRFLRYDDRHGGYGYWAALEKSTGEFLGWFGLQARAEGDPDDAVLGYRLRRTAWGKGYATEGVRALIRKGFSELGMRRVSATTYEENLASRRVLEKSGLKLVRVFRMTPAQLLAEGTYQATPGELWEGDDLEYALNKADWERQRPSQGQILPSRSR